MVGYSRLSGRHHGRNRLHARCRSVGVILFRMICVCIKCSFALYCVLKLQHSSFMVHYNDVGTMTTDEILRHKVSNLWNIHYTVDGLIFVGNQFSWFSWRVRSMYSSVSVWIMKVNTMATNFEPHECVIFVQSTKIGTNEIKPQYSKITHSNKWSC